MRERRKMPTKRQILDWWKDVLWDAPDDVNLCWGCGFRCGTQRAHIVDRCKGGADEPSNLALLCKDCHDAQENWCNIKGHHSFVDAIVDGAPFMNHKIMKYQIIHDRTTDETV